MPVDCRTHSLVVSGGKVSGHTVERRQKSQHIECTGVKPPQADAATAVELQEDQPSSKLPGSACKSLHDAHPHDLMFLFDGFRVM